MPNDALNNAIIGIFNQRQSLHAIAKSQIRAAFAPAIARGFQLSQPSNRTFKLTLERPALVPQARRQASATVTASSGAPSQIAAAVADVASVIFDVAPSPGRTVGFMQRVSYKRSARQSIQHTLSGFHVNEYNESPGRLDLEADVVWTTTPNNDVRNFFNLLKSAKRSNPLSTGTPAVVRFFDTFLGLSLTISQEDISLEQSAERQNMGRLRISAAVLYDADFGGSPQFASIPSVGQAVEAAALSALTNLL